MTVWITTINKSLGCDLYRLKLIIPKFRRHLYAVLRCFSIWERSFPGNRNHHAKTTTVIATRQYWYVLVGMVSFEEVIKIFHYWLWDPATRHIHPPGHILRTGAAEQQQCEEITWKFVRNHEEYRELPSPPKYNQNQFANWMQIKIARY